MMSSETPGRGPSWWDVEEALKALEKRWGSVWLVEMVRNPGRGAQKGTILVQLCQREYRQQHKPGHDRRFKSESWPHRDHRTMPGLLLRMCHEAEEGLLAEEEELTPVQVALELL